MTVKNAEKAWKEARVLHELPDTANAREAFYHGARYVLGTILETDPDEQLDAMASLNEELHKFGSATLSIEKAPQ